MSIDSEFKRVLSNPEHIIVSEELSGMLQEENAKTEDSFLIIGEKTHVCNIIRVKILGGSYCFSLDVPSFSLRDLLVTSDPIQINFEGLQYKQISSTDVLWEDNILTLETRRILNEAV